MSEKNIGVALDSLTFEKKRFEYCQQIFKEEASRKEILEKKSQFILSFLTLLLGALFLKLDFVQSMQNMLSQKKFSSNIQWGLYITLAIVFLSIIIALIAVLLTVQLQKFKNEYPDNVLNSLFSPNSDYFESKSEEDFYYATSMSYTIALESYIEANDKKVWWIGVSWYSTLVSVISLAVFIALFVYVVLS